MILQEHTHIKIKPSLAHNAIKNKKTNHLKKGLKKTFKKQNQLCFYFIINNIF